MHAKVFEYMTLEVHAVVDHVQCQVQSTSHLFAFLVQQEKEMYLLVPVS